MAYATEYDLVSRFEALVLEPGDNKVKLAINDASAFIDGYLAVRHALPLPTVPPVLKSLCVDIAVYNLMRDGAAMSEDVRKRFEDAKSYLKSVARGETILPDQPGKTTKNGPGAAFYKGRPRVMGRR